MTETIETTKSTMNNYMSSTMETDYESNMNDTMIIPTDDYSDNVTTTETTLNLGEENFAFVYAPFYTLMFLSVSLFVIAL